MTATRSRLTLAAIATVVVIGATAGTAAAQGQAPAAPVVVANPGPPGGGGPGQTIGTVNTGQNQNPGGPRPASDRIDLSVCELATFDHKKCLGS